MCLVRLGGESSLASKCLQAQNLITPYYYAHSSAIGYRASLSSDTEPSQVLCPPRDLVNK